MPNRIIREGILSSERVDEIAEDSACEIFYRRLFSVVDDFGRFSGDPRMIRAALYPLRLDSVPACKISEFIAACEAAGLLITYAVEGKPYLELLDFRQRLRRMVSKYPPRLKVNGQSSDGEVRPESESESESETEVESETETCAPQVGAPVCSPSSSDSQTPATTIKDQQAAWFEEFWKCYWLKKSKAAAFKAFKRHVRSEARFREVMEAVAAQSPEMTQREPRHRPYASSWLNGERWLDSTSEEARVRDPILDAVYGSEEKK